MIDGISMLIYSSDERSWLPEFTSVTHHAVTFTLYFTQHPPYAWKRQKCLITASLLNPATGKSATKLKPIMPLFSDLSISAWVLLRQGSCFGMFSSRLQNFF